MKIYTKTGDKGETSLVSGRRVSKAAGLIEAYGSVDELNSFVGDLITVLDDPILLQDLNYVQNILFNIGSLLARDDADIADYPTLEGIDITYLEQRMDLLNKSLTKMTAFILPSGNAAITKAHICRTVCRRAERRVIQISEHIETTQIVIYLNRLSDYFFVLARYCHVLADLPEQKWDNQIRTKY